MKVILETERLLLREFLADDAEGMFNLNSDPEVVLYTGDGPFESVEEARKFLEDYKQVYSKWGFGRWAVILKSNGETLGWCGLRQYKEDEGVDLGFRFFKKHWGKGYATESALACTKYAFEKLKLEKLIGRARKENFASLRVLEKCGMKRIGEGKDCDGEIWVYEITSRNHASSLE
jgi:[ribosomal protein S5]-alanine N-acetyltransferase